MNGSVIVQGVGRPRTVSAFLESEVDERGTNNLIPIAKVGIQIQLVDCLQRVGQAEQSCENQEFIHYYLINREFRNILEVLYIKK